MMAPQSFTPARQNPAVAAVLVLLATAFFAGSTFLAKTLGTPTFGDPLHALQVAQARFVFGFIAVGMVAVWFRMPPRTQQLPLHIARTVFGVAGISLMFAAVAAIPLSDAIAISFLNPVFAMGLAVVFLSERAGRWRIGAAFVAFIGAVVLLRPGAGAVHPGALLALGAAVIIAVEVTFLKMLSGRENPLRILLVNNFIGAIIASLAAVWFWASPTPEQWLALVGVGVLMVCGQGLFVNALARSDTSFAAPFTYMTLIFASLLDMLVFQIWPDLPSAMGAAMIVGAGLVLAWRESVRK